MAQGSGKRRKRRTMWMRVKLSAVILLSLVFWAAVLYVIVRWTLDWAETLDRQKL
jgi:succinate dehydrogenase hydrophobic anchor subunit